MEQQVQYFRQLNIYKWREEQEEEERMTKVLVFYVLIIILVKFLIVRNIKKCLTIKEKIWSQSLNLHITQT